MIYQVDFDINQFKFWSGAYDRVKELSYDRLQELGQLIEDVFCDCTPTDTDINDFVWFDCDDFFYPDEDENDEEE